MDKIKSIKISIAVTNIFLCILVIFCVALPWMVSWYVETMKRSATLATTVLVTCYPCAPFAGACLVFLRKLLKNVLKNGLMREENFGLMKKIIICCIIIAAMTLVAGKFYLPFLIVSATFTFVALLLFGLRAALYVTANENTNP